MRGCIHHERRLLTKRPYAKPQLKRLGLLRVLTRFSF